MHPVESVPQGFAAHSSVLRRQTPFFSMTGVPFDDARQVQSRPWGGVGS
jgi:hypothetical protein